MFLDLLRLGDPRSHRLLRIGPFPLRFRRILIGKYSGELCMSDGSSSVDGTFVHPKMLEPSTASPREQAKPTQHQFRFARLIILLLRHMCFCCTTFLARRFAPRALFFRRLLSSRTHGTSTHLG